MESNAIPTVPILNLGNNNNDLISAIMSLKNGNANSDMMNNPFLWLIFLALFGSNGFGGFGGGNATTNADIQRLEGLINNNHNNDLALSAINGNREAITSLASNLNCSVASLTNAIDGVRNAMSSCCCDIKTLIQSTAYETQLRDLTNTNSINSNLCNISNTITNGFANIGYTSERNTNMIIQAQNANTQRLVDLINTNNVNELTEKLNQARLELSQSNQTQAIIAALKPTTTTTA
jgi:hypothetical protein